MDLLLMFLTILLWSHLASSQSWKRRSSISLQGGGDYESDDTVKGKELDGSIENEYEYEYLSDETAPNSLSDDDETKNTPKKQSTDIMSFTFDFYKQMHQFFVQMSENLDHLMDKMEGEEDISKGFHAGDYGNDRQLTKHEDKGHRLVPVRVNRPLNFRNRETVCNRPSKQGNCCTKGSPCKLGGVCDRDLDCEGDLVCGIDNCHDFYPDIGKYNGEISPYLGADCCKVKFDSELCRANHGKEDDGNCDCDRDEDCNNDEVCGEDNSQHPNPSAPGYDSCIRKEDSPLYTEREAGCTAHKYTKKNCCSKESPCKLGGGDCDRDVDCEGDLVCGVDNCRDFYPFPGHSYDASKRADCCKIKYDVQGCQEHRGRLKRNNDGNCDCDRDEDCLYDWVCVKDGHQHNTSTPRYDRCKPCSGTAGTENCPWSEGAECNRQEDCKGSLLCHKHKRRDPYRRERLIKCTEPGSFGSVKDCIGIIGQESCCTPDSTCGEGQGVCRYDEDCRFNLMCGHRNCQDFNSTARKNYNCCTKKSVVCGKSTYKTMKVDRGESASFKIQKSKKYKSKSKCEVKFELGPGCAKLKFYCSKLKLGYKGKSCSKAKGDKLVIERYNTKNKSRTKIYCKRKSVVKSSGSLMVKFTSNKKKNYGGAECMIKCYKNRP